LENQDKEHRRKGAAASVYHFSKIGEGKLCTCTHTIESNLRIKGEEEILKYTEEVKNIT
jgi:hypothetical protein